MCIWPLSLVEPTCALLRVGDLTRACTPVKFRARRLASPSTCGIPTATVSRIAQGKRRVGLHDGVPLDAVGLLGRRQRGTLCRGLLPALSGCGAHGDFASWTAEGGLIIHGRSDATLNAGGVRIRTAEIYRQVDQLPEVQESLAIGQAWG